MSTWLPLVTAASPVPDPEVGAIVDQVARQFAEANGRGFEGWEPKLLKEAARNYHAKITPMAMPWPVDQGTAETFVPPVPDEPPPIFGTYFGDGDLGDPSFWPKSVIQAVFLPLREDVGADAASAARWPGYASVRGRLPVSYTHLTLPTKA